MKYAVSQMMIAFLIFLQVSSSLPVLAQEPGAVTEEQAAPEPDAATEVAEAEEDYFMSDAHRRDIYEKRRKKTGKAVLLSLALPGLGNIYADQYLVGGIGITLVVFSAVFLTYGITTQQPDIATYGVVLLAGAYIGTTTIAIVGVNNYNRQLRQGLKIEGTAVNEYWAPALAIRF